MKLDLDLILSGIPWTQNFKHPFNATTDTEIIKAETPLYAVPGQLINNSFRIGIYMPNEELIYVPIGLSQTRDFDTTYYRYDRSSTWVAEDEKREVTYLPLRKTNIRSDLINKGKSLDGSPFFVYTINGLEYLFPFVIFDLYNDESARSHGFYKSATGLGTFVNYVNRTEEKKWRKHFAYLDAKVYKFISFKKGADEIKIETEKIQKPEAALAITSSNPLGNASGSLNQEPEKAVIDWAEPTSIKAYLDRYIIGQHQAKKTLAIAFSNYLAEIQTKKSLPREHVMLIGPTGSGKTKMISLLVKEANLPKAVTKLPMNTKEGFVGGSLSDSCQRIQAQTSEQNPYGVIIVDEIDKASPGRHSYNWGNELQDELVSLLEETSMKLTINKGTGRQDKWFNTKNLLFVAAGAFHGGEGISSIYDIIAYRLGGGSKKKIGFQLEELGSEKEPSRLLDYLIPDDLVKFGLKPELVGRFSARAVLRQLTVNDKVRILNESEDSPLYYYQRLFEIKGYKLEIDEEAKRAIAKACPEETGARALNDICCNLFSEIIYQPSGFADAFKIIRVGADLTKELISKTEKPSTEISAE